MVINKERESLQLEAFNALKKNNFNGIVLIVTGGGKTKIMVDCLKHLKPKKVLYLCDGTRLRDVDFPNELKKWGAAKWIDKIDRQCYKTAYKWKGEKYDLVLADEFDAALTKEYIKSIKNNHFKHKVLLSATLSEDKRKMAEKIAPIIFEKGIGDLTDSGIVNKEQIYFVNYNLTEEENARYISYNESFRKLLNESNPNKFKLEQLQISRTHFLNNLESAKETTIKLLRDLYKDKSNKILVFCGSTDQANKICKYTYHTGSKHKNWLEKFDKGEIRVLAVCNMVNRGVNIKDANIAVFVKPERSSVRTLQKSGRTRRLEIDETAYLYFLIPFFKNRKNERKATIIQDYVLSSCKDMNLKDAKTYKFND